MAYPEFRTGHVFLRVSTIKMTIGAIVMRLAEINESGGSLGKDEKGYRECCIMRLLGVV
jgi:hypothetical protein